MSKHVQIKHDWRQLGELCAAVHKAETFDALGAALDGLYEMQVCARTEKAEPHFTHAIDVAFDTAARKFWAFVTDPAIVSKIVP